jgi:hypothetical protein
MSKLALQISTGLLAAIPVVTGLIGLAGHQAPAGQSPLADLTSDSVVPLKAEFNRSADGVRIVLLLSPT